MEIWKDIVGYEGLYQVSNYGRVYSHLTERILRHHNCLKGYARLILRKNGSNYGHTVHRLVALAFIDNPNNFPEVNHKDENPRNNVVDNLEWCTHQYNNTYGTKIARMVAHTDYSVIADKNSKPVAQYDLNGNYIRSWKSLQDCSSSLGYDNSAIAKCCNNKLLQVYGYQWRYINGDIALKITKFKSANKKMVCQYDLSGNLIQVWNGMREAERTLGLANGSISACVNGKVSTSSGYIWRLSEVN